MKKIEYGRFNTKGLQPLPLIGVDEVGRGCLAGPVVAAAVIFRSEHLSEDVTDSKLLSEQRRQELSALIYEHHSVGLGSASVEEIEEINILQASLLAMKRAIEKLGATTGHLLIDGNQKIPGLLHWPQTTVIKGDLRVPQISAASIVAKVYRDQWMRDLGKQFAKYGFEKHKGYSTERHKRAIAKHGPCDLHRKTFSGVKEFI